MSEEKPLSGLDINGAVLMRPDSGPTAMTRTITMTDFPTRGKKYNSYFYNSRSSSLAGPFSSEITTVCSRPNSAEMYAVNQKREVLTTDLLDLNSNEFNKIENPPVDITESFSSVKTGGIVANKKGAFLYRGKYIDAPFSEPKNGGGEVHSPLYFKDCALSIAETHWMHFGSEAAEKEVYRVDLNFHKNSYGFLWLFVQNDEGRVSGQYKGEIKETIKVFTNLRGRRFRTKMFIATHENYPWALREIAVGYNLGKSF